MIRRLVILCLASLSWLPSPALAAWATNWPAWQYPREQNDQIRQCHSGVVERCTVAGVAAPASPAWYRSNRTTVTNMKAKLQAIVTGFVNTNLSSGGTFDDYFETISPLYPSTNAAGNHELKAGLTFPMFTVTGLLVSAGLPTNYFSYTPYRGLSGVGGATNDASVGHGHGETNATTVKGGTSYPSGRTVWYTTDYGLDGIKLVLNRLVWRKADVAPSAFSGQEGTTTFFEWAGDTKDQAWALYDTALSTVSGRYSASSSATHAGVYTRKAWFEWALWQWSLWKITSVGTWAASSLSTNIGHDVQFYHYSTKPWYTSPTYPEYSVFDDYGLPLTEDVMVLCGEYTSSMASSVTNTVGSTNDIAWCDKPAYDNPGGGTEQGVHFSYTSRVLIKYTATNGFLYP